MHEQAPLTWMDFVQGAGIAIIAAALAFLGVVTMLTLLNTDAVPALHSNTVTHLDHLQRQVAHLCAHIGTSCP